MRKFAIAVWALALALAATPAGAAVVVTTYTLGNGGGSFEVDHDTGTDSYTLGTTNLVIDGVAYTEGDSVLDASGSPFELSGAITTLVMGQVVTVSDFDFFFDPLESTQSVTIDGQANFIAYSIDAPLTASSAVPEPASWAMLLLGFAGIAYASRKQPVAALA